MKHDWDRVGRIAMLAFGVLISFGQVITIVLALTVFDQTPQRLGVQYGDKLFPVVWLILCVLWGGYFVVQIAHETRVVRCERCGQLVETYGGGGYWRHVERGDLTAACLSPRPPERHR